MMGSNTYKAPPGQETKIPPAAGRPGRYFGDSGEYRGVAELI